MKVQTTSIFSRISEALEQGYTTISEQGSARCFAKGTLVRMANGILKPIEEISVGDKVMNLQGNGYNTVIETHHGVDDMFLIHQHRGIDYVVNSQHILTFKQTQAFYKKLAIDGYKSAEKRQLIPLPYDKDVFMDMPVSDYIQQSHNFKEKYSAVKQTLIQLPEKALPIDPYYLGVWLGDGVSREWNTIGNCDQDVLDYFYSFAQALGTEAYYAGKNTHRIRVVEKGTRNKALGGETRRIRDAFIELGLLNNKHIPDIYIYNSYENRLKLLAGIIDTDGWDSKRNTYNITQKNRRIIEGVLELCRLSGFYTNGITTKRAKMKRTDGSVYECEVCQIEINHNDFADLHKYMRLNRRKFTKSCDRNYFTSKITVTPQGKGEYYGFTLDNEPYFLLQDGTICHNSGKTWNTLIWIVVYCLKNPNTTVSIVRKTNPALTGSVMRDFITIVQDMEIWERSSFNKSSQMYTFPNGSWVEFFSTDDEQKLRGRKRQVLYVNEGNELREIEWKQLKMRTTKFAIIDYNPSFSDDHWLCGLNRDERTYHFITTYKENPFLEQVVIDEIESYKETSPMLWRIYGLGLQALVEGLVFEKWDEQEFPEWADKQGIGMDFGYSKDPTAIVRCAVIGNDLYLDEVCYKTEMLTSEISSTLLPYDLDVIADSADPRLIQEIFNSGVLIYPIQKFAGSIMAGIMKMLEFNIHISPRSTNLQREFRNYVYVQDKDGNFVNKPIDAFNHCFVGSTMITTNKGLKRIDEMRAGDMVLTSEGYKKVNKVFHNGEHDVNEYTINGIKVVSTSTHKVKTKAGFKEISKLEIGDSIYIHEKVAKVWQMLTKPMGKEFVYNMEVEECHEYYANGILVSNCIDAARYWVMGEVMGRVAKNVPIREEDIGIW